MGGGMNSKSKGHVAWFGGGPAFLLTHEKVEKMNQTKRTNCGGMDIKAIGEI